MRSLSCCISVLVVGACAPSGPEWLTVQETPKVTVRVDQKSIVHRNSFASARFLMLYSAPFASPDLPKEHWSSVATIEIDCKAVSWRVTEAKTFAKNGSLVQTFFASGTPQFFVVPSKSQAVITARRVCNHALGIRSISDVGEPNPAFESGPPSAAAQRER